MELIRQFNLLLRGVGCGQRSLCSAHIQSPVYSSVPEGMHKNVSNIMVNICQSCQRVSLKLPYCNKYEFALVHACADLYLPTVGYHDDHIPMKPCQQLQFKQ